VQGGGDLSFVPGTVSAKGPPAPGLALSTRKPSQAGSRLKSFNHTTATLEIRGLGYIRVVISFNHETKEASKARGVFNRFSTWTTG